MFQQEINLYKAFEEPKAPSSIISWHRLKVFNMIFIFVMVSMTILDFIELHYLKNTRNSLQLTNNALEKEFYALKKQYPDIFFNNNVEESINKPTKEMEGREKIFQRVANKSLFLEKMRAFGRVIIPDVWLTKINISQSGDSVNVSGKSISVEKMQQFISRVMQDEVFQHYFLSVENIEDNTKSDLKGDLDFELMIVREQK